MPRSSRRKLRGGCVVKALDVRLVDRRFRATAVSRRRSVPQSKYGCDHDASGGRVRRAVLGWSSRGVGSPAVGDAAPGPSVSRSAIASRVRIGEQLVRIAAKPRSGSHGPCTRKPVTLARARMVRKVAVPELAVSSGEGRPRVSRRRRRTGRARPVVGDAGEHREVRAGAVEGRAERIRFARPPGGSRSSVPAARLRLGSAVTVRTPDPAPSPATAAA